MSKKPRNPGHAVRVSREAFQKLLRLQGVVVAGGWRALGMGENPRQPTLSAVVEAAIELLGDQEV